MNKQADNTHIIKKIINFQKQYDISLIKADDLKIWPLILSELKFYTNTTKPKSLTERVNFISSIRKELAGIFKMLKQMHDDRHKSLLVQKNAKFLFLTQPARREKMNGQYFDRITDPFYDVLIDAGYSARVLEWTFDNKIKTPRKNPSEFIQLSIYKAFIKNVFRKKPKFKLELLYTPEFSEILSVYNVEQKKFIKTIKRNVALILSLKNMFQKKLRNSAATTAFFFPHYGIMSFAFNLACKSRNIKTAEIQHAYIDANKITEHGYYEIKEKYDLLPDAIWCWSDNDKMTIDSWSSDKAKIPFAYVGGNLWVQMWKYPIRNNNKLYKLVEQQKRNDFHAKKKKVLITLSPHYNIPEWFPDIVNSSVSDIDWLIRFHHNTESSTVTTYRKAFSAVSENNFSLANNNILPLLLKISHLHVTIDSSSIAEASEYGVKTIIVTEKGAQMFKKFINSMQAFKVTSSKNFLTKVNELLSLNENSFERKKENSKSNKELVLDFLNTIDSI
jgi:hypothetical protein